MSNVDLFSSVQGKNMSVNLTSFGVTVAVSSERFLSNSQNRLGCFGCLFYQGDRRLECVHCTAS